MAAALRRILKFRKLTEEQARLQLEQAMQLLRRATTARERTLAMERRQRSALAESWTPEPGHSSEATSELGSTESGDRREDTWLLEKTALELSSLQRTRLKEIEEREAKRVEPMIESYKGKRRELRQTELLLEKQSLLEILEKDRRIQAETDEWFLQRGLADRRQSERRERLLNDTQDETS